MANIYVYSGAAGAGTGADWANAYTGIAAGVNAATAGDDVWVADDHAETGATAITFTNAGTVTSPVRVICARRSGGSVPPVAADIRATASVTTAAGAAITFSSAASGCCYYEGIAFRAGNAGANTANINFNPSQNSRQLLKNCTLDLNNTNASSIIDIGGTGTTSWDILWDNVVVDIGTASQFIGMANGKLRWINTSSALKGTVPTTLFTSNTSSRTTVLELDGVDLSSKSSGSIVGAGTGGQFHVTLKDCRIHASATISADQTIPGHEVVATRTASSGVNYTLNRFAVNGNQATVTSPVRNGGAAGPDTTAIAWQLTTSSAAKRLIPYELIPVAVWNPTTGSNGTATMHGRWDSASLPTDAEVWADFYYLGSASYPIAKVKSTAPATILTTAANLTATTEDWDDGVTARANSTAYSVGDRIKLASNTGRVFFCTAGGTSNGSEPAGYATAVDGDSVTDSGATFRAGRRFKVETTFSSPQPAQAGAIFARLYVAAASVARMYVDPKIVLS